MFGKRLEAYLRGTEIKFDVLLDNQSLCYSLLNIQKSYPLVTTIHHPITRDHKIALDNARNWKERLSTNRWHGFLKMQKKQLNLKFLKNLKRKRNQKYQNLRKQNNILVLWSFRDSYFYC